MLAKAKKFLIIAAMGMGMVMAFAPAVPVAAQADEGAKQAACAGLGVTGQNECDEGASNSIRGILRAVIGLLSWVVGIAAVIMVIIGGFKFVTSNGDSNGINSAKSTVIYALVGLAVAALAQVLVRTVLVEVT